MAEKVEITWVITLVVKKGVTTDFPLQLSTESHLNWGKYKKAPPAMVEVPVKDESNKNENRMKEFTVISCGRASSSSGTEGYFIYDAYDNNTHEPTRFTFKWDVTWGSKAHSVEAYITSSSGRYKFECESSGVPGDKFKVTASAKITQVEPTI